MNQTSSPSQPVFLAPAALKWLVGLTVGVHLILEFAPPSLAQHLYIALVYIPLRFAHMDLIQQDLVATLLSPAGYALLHGSWLHLGVNMGMLLAFGTPLIRQTGTPFFLLVYVIGALAGAASVSLLAPESPVHLMGASASVSALLGALIACALAPAIGMRHRQLGVFQSRQRTLSFLGMWIGINILTGLLPGNLLGGGGRIAWEAHLGGLAAGLLLGWLNMANLRRRGEF